MAEIVVNGAVSNLAALGSNDRPRVFAVNKGGVIASIQTDDSMRGLVYATETPDALLFSYSELNLAQARQALGLPIFDELAIEVRGRLGQAPLAPTILCDSAVLPPMADLDWGGGGRTGNFLIGAFAVRAKSRIQPRQCSVPELLDRLIEVYRKKMSESRRIGVFMSAGWDSRLELACISHAYDPNRQEIVLIHLCDGPEDLSIVQSLAGVMGCALEVHNREELTVDFLKLGDFSRYRSQLDELPTWRPSIPANHVAARRFIAAGGDIVMGFAPHSLKGRQYDISFSDALPVKGLFRVISDVNAENIVEFEQVQRKTWSNLRSICSDWDEFAQRDYLLWVLHNGFSYSHRCWPRINPEIITVNNDPTLVSDFMGLDQKFKRGTAFVKRALAELCPEFLNIPLRSSTGEEGISHSTRRYVNLAFRDTVHAQLYSSLANGHSHTLVQASPNIDLLATIQLKRFLEKFDS